MKDLAFEGDSLARLRDFPAGPMHDAGYALEQVQAGEDPPDWKPFKTIGAGGFEIRVQDDSGAYRVMYVVKFPEAVYVLHAFKKTTQKTSQKDIDLASDRFAKLVARRKKNGL